MYSVAPLMTSSVFIRLRMEPCDSNERVKYTVNLLGKITANYGSAELNRRGCLQVFHASAEHNLSS